MLPERFDEYVKTSEGYFTLSRSLTRETSTTNKFTGRPSEEMLRKFFNDFPKPQSESKGKTSLQSFEENSPTNENSPLLHDFSSSSSPPSPRNLFDTVTAVPPLSLITRTSEEEETKTKSNSIATTLPTSSSSRSLGPLDGPSISEDEIKIKTTMTNMEDPIIGQLRIVVCGPEAFSASVVNLLTSNLAYPSTTVKIL